MMSFVGILIDDDEKKRDTDREEAAPNSRDSIEKLALDHAWNWFRYHAEQRIALFRFYILALGGMAAGVGLLHQQGKHAVCAMVCVFAMCAVFCFVRLDNRSSDLVKQGTKALSVGQKSLAERTKNENLQMCPLTELPPRCLYTYGQSLKLIMFSAMVLFAVMACYTLCYSQHVHRVLGALVS